MNLRLISLLVIIFSFSISLAQSSETLPEWAVRYNNIVKNIPIGIDREKSINTLENAISLIDTNSELGINYLSSGTAELMILYMDQGQYDKAEKIGSSVLSYYSKQKRQNYSGYHQLLVAFGRLYAELRDFDRAISIYEKAKYFYEAYHNIGREYASVLGGMSLIYLSQKNLLKSKIYEDVSRDVINKCSDANVYDKITVFNNLAMIYSNMGYNKEAIYVLEESKDIAENENTLHYMLPYIYDNIAVHYDNIGDNVKSLANFEKAYSFGKKYGYNDWPILYGNLSMSYLKSGQLNRVYDYSNEMASFLKGDALNKFSYLDYDAREKYWKRNNLFLAYANSLMLRSKSDSVNAKIYDNVLFSKGLLLKTSNYITDNILNSTDNALKQNFLELTKYKNRLAKGDIVADSIEIYKYATTYLDKILVEKVADYAELRKTLQYNWNDIRKSLDEDEAAIEYVPLYDIRENQDTIITCYAAAIIKRSYNKPIIIKLCSNDHIDSLLYNNSSTSIDRFVNTLYDGPKGQNLYDSVWSPIDKELAGIKHIYYSPSGLLSKISFNAFKVGEKRLSEIYDLHLVTSTSEVIRMKTEKNEEIHNAVIYGGIRYDVSDSTMIANANRYSNHNNNTKEESRGLFDNSWFFLPGTKEEAYSIKNILGQTNIVTQIFDGENANEESFKNLSNKKSSIIHIATHGFFLEKKDFSNSLSLQESSNRDSEAFEDPMKSTGLLFAGANKAWLEESIVPGIEDGILTAEEISCMNLKGTELVVLSACMTGLGNVDSPEGVFGLQRAFKLAGVKSIVMSLWEVPDIATAKLMELFYTYISRNMERHDAFRNAMLKLKEEYKDPHDWAGFVLLD